MASVNEEMGLEFAIRDSETGKNVKLAMEELWLTGRVLPVGARLVLRHVFKSAERKPLELVYTYGLPRDATLRSFRVVGEGFTVESDLKETSKAMEDYEEAVQSGHLAVLNRVYHDGLSSLIVGNVRPGETVAVYLEILAGVESHDDGFRFRFPFTLAPSYHREARVAVTPEGHGEMELPQDRYDDLMLPPWSESPEHLHTVGFELLVEPGSGGEIASPSHMLAVKMDKDSSAFVRLANMEDMPNRDLVLDIKTEAQAPKCFAGIDGADKVQFAALVPSTAFGERRDGPTRAVFVVDRSGSMGGTPMEQAKKAIRACLGALAPEDQFGIVAFDNSTEVLSAGLLPGTMENRQMATQFLSRVHARGGTELLQGLIAAATALGQAGGDIFLLTDGQVFAGSEIMAGMRNRGCRVHCLGIGSASQDRFLALLARETGGVSRFMTPRERIDIAALELFASVGRPIATGVTCSLAGAADAKLSPAPADVVFAGSPLIVYGTSSTDGESVLHLTFEGASGPGKLECPISPSSQELGETLRLLRGARIITDLESRLSQETAGRGVKGRRAANRAEEMLKKASREYGLSSQCMSLVAVVKREGDVEGEVPETRVVPVGMPQDTRFGGYFGGAPSTLFCETVSPLSHTSASLSGLMPRRRAAKVFEDSASIDELLEECRENESKTALHSEDFLVELAAMLEPDGGMPGDDFEERVLASLLALLTYYAEGHTHDHGPFAPHVKRLTTFLRLAELAALSDGRQAVLSRLLDGIGGKGPLRRLDSDTALKFIVRRSISPKEAWERLDHL